MARETKVGLLAGLAFIICFAVILTNRGREGIVDRHFPQGLPSFSNESAVETAGAPATVATTRPPAESLRDRHGISNPAHGTTQPQRFNDPAVPIGELTMQDSDFANESANDDWRARLESRVAELTAALNENERPQPIAMTANPPAPSQRHELRESSPETSTNGQPIAPPLRSELVRYRVVKGDTLSGIAYRHYGTRSRTIINAIVDANRSIIPGPAQVRADSTLVLPEVTGFAAPTPDAAQRLASEDKTAHNEPKGSVSGPKAFRWYQIRKNDRYASIARRELGDERRWPELHELNKDKFPDASQIREGVKIKLPVDSQQKAENLRS